jgi:hypothetical protein
MICLLFMFLYLCDECCRFYLYLVRLSCTFSFLLPFPFLYLSFGVCLERPVLIRRLFYLHTPFLLSFSTFLPIFLLFPYAIFTSRPPPAHRIYVLQRGVSGVPGLALRLTNSYGLCFDRRISRQLASNGCLLLPADGRPVGL